MMFLGLIGSEEGFAALARGTGAAGPDEGVWRGCTVVTPWIMVLHGANGMRGASGADEPFLDGAGAVTDDAADTVAAAPVAGAAASGAAMTINDGSHKTES